ncbi:polyketide synthase [Haoranjiania flava]|uniref:Amino acid adenylation domain-containing protein n=1 Tax=Haoranjiania flava TaxID=1856322 RepID=A0AAE3LMS2_9BACT|nr:polyketide synthase [Haoranjiania flava]MCU7694196.1 amino acid adenylation domain-containing protein [Haoranjiania flava]
MEMYCVNSFLYQFSQTVNIFKDSKAITFKDKSYSYAELDAKANSISHSLITKNIKKGDIVAVYLDRGPELIFSIIGILKCGAAYLPIDPFYPEERIQLMLKDASAKFLLTSKELEVACACGEKILIEEILQEKSEIAGNPHVSIGSEDLAYVIYTSGSTGIPKGVMVTHGNIVHFLKGMQRVFRINASDKFLSVSSISFDASCFDIFLSLSRGAALILTDNDTAKDGKQLLQTFVENNATIMLATPVTYQLMLHAGWKDKLPATIISAGEVLPQKLAAELLQRCSALYNVYGPTETTVICILTQIFSADDITIGKPAIDTPVYILNDKKEKLEAGEVGEIYIGGKGVSKGYLHNESLTAERFLQDPFANDKDAKMYKSGDLGRWRKDGKIDYAGRMDNQVKLRGYRIELGEIEYRLMQDQYIRHAVVLTDEADADNKRLVAYVVLKDQGDRDKLETIKAGLKKSLPEFMVPDQFIFMTIFPINPNGKVDRKKLLSLSAKHNIRKDLFKRPETEIQKNIASAWSAVLKTATVGIDDNFFENGGNSLLAQRLASSLQQEYSYDLPVTIVYQYPTVSQLSGYLHGEKGKLANCMANKEPGKNKDIAVIGMECNFPGAGSISEFWHVLKSGKETVSFFDSDEIDSSVDESIKNDPAYIKARGILKDVDQFDADFFNINPKLAELMDPQQRIFLEVCRNLLEKTGYLQPAKEEVTGVFAGCGTNTYFHNNVIHHKDKINKVGYFNAASVSDKDYIGMRISYHLNLTGPSVNVNSACSTSLLAIAQAVESLRAGQCTIAIAGGVSIHVPVQVGHVYEDGSIFSADGHSRPFDKNAAGTVFSDGAGAVLLKPLADAERDGDTIYAVIKGVGICNDGGNKGSFMAPNAEGQAAAIKMAMENAQVHPSQISYIETHGTATPIGDPIEFEGMKMAFGEQRKTQYCAIGSLKSNVGHLTHAAGVAGFIKTALALHHKKIPASINYSAPNPVIDFSKSPFVVNHQLTEWNCDGARIAGVSSFGVGGTNVHVILKDYNNTVIKSTTLNQPAIIKFSAANADSLQLYFEKLLQYAKEHVHEKIEDVAYTLNIARDDFPVRSYLVASDMKDLVVQLSHKEKLVSRIHKIHSKDSKIVFMFPGQGSQYLNMGKALYHQLPVFRNAVDECAYILLEETGEDIRDVIFSQEETQEQKEKLKNTKYAQAAIFTISYALARQFVSWEIEPKALVGHSVGEFVAAHLAGVFSLKDVLKIISCRGKIISALPAGLMLSVRASAESVKDFLPEQLSVAAVNAPQLCVLSGDADQVKSFAEQLSQRNIAHNILHTSHAFHSTMMAPAVDPLFEVVRSITLSKPYIPVVSTVTGTWLKDEEAMDPVYWAAHVRSCVNFSKAIQTLEAEWQPVYLELGPGTTAATLAKQHDRDIRARAFSALDMNDNAENEIVSVQSALGELWSSGVHINWRAVYQHTNYNLLHDVPTYAFNKKRHWVDPPKTICNQASRSPEGFKQISKNKQVPHVITMERKDILIEKIKEIFESASGIDITDNDVHSSFMQLGLDSLLLTQIASSVKKEFQLPVTFRQLNESYDSIEKLAVYLDENLSPSAYQQEVKINSDNEGSISHQARTENTGPLELIQQQLQQLAQQVSLLSEKSAPQPQPGETSISPVTQAEPAVYISPEEITELKKPFGATARIEKTITGITAQQKEYLTNFIEQYNKKTAGSKEYTQYYRSCMADPRVVSGFKPLTKEMIYSIVIKKSAGAYLWDVDGNQYIDALNGFGSNFLGYQSPVLKKALLSQVENGYEIGPQHALAGSVCKLVCELTGFNRAALCNTGSEAVLGAMRIARSITNKALIVAFTGSYHGINDEVLVRGTKKLQTFAAASGILNSNVQNMLILDYGTAASLQIIRERIHEIAGVLVEPVQSRRPEFVPLEFLRALRALTQANEVPLIFDEVITGFRAHNGGFQAMFGIRADIAVYGKVVGGGLPVGVIAGDKKYLDALDGGYWQYEDGSVPEVGVTYFAGTFVRHPLALSTALASLNYLKQTGGKLQESLNVKTSELSIRLNTICKKYGVPVYVVHFSSLWKIKFREEYPYSELLFSSMRFRNIHIWDGFPCFLTTAHTAQDIDKIITAFEESIKELCHAGFIPYTKKTTKSFINIDPPVSGARLGKDKEGNPAWFLQDISTGKYMLIDDE